MTHDRDIERILSHWLGDGPTEVPDRVMDDVAGRIERQPQRPAWRVNWRNPTMTTSLRTVAAVAAVVIFAVGAIYLIGPGSGPGVGGGPDRTASPSPTVSPTPAPSLKAISSSTFQPALHLEAPADWSITDGNRTFNLDAPAAFSGSSIGVMTAPFVRFDDRDCQNRAPAGVGTSVAEVVATLSGDPRLLVSPAPAVAVGDLTGQALDIQVARTWTGTCGWSNGKRAVLILSATDTGPAFGLQGTERARFIFLDVGGSVVSVNIGVPDESKFEAFVAEATPIVESMRFTQ